MVNTAKLVKNTVAKDTLVNIFADRKNWNKYIDIEGFLIIYNSEENMGRVVENRDGYRVDLPVFCFAFGNFMWCC